MPRNNKPLIVVDAGHGGWDNGASWDGRLEKDDNLRLAMAVQRQLLDQGIPVLMTRDSDIYVTLEDRASMANEAGADLFISLHRNSYPEQTLYTNGVENYIYLTAPEATTGRAARLVLDRVVEVGVQADRGVSRGDYYVLRRTNMPAMLLEMGFIINEIDNMLFDEHLEDYAAAIAEGAMQYFELPFIPPCPVCPDAGVMEAQLLLNQRLNLEIPPTGIFDAASRTGAIMALQITLNSDFNAGLSVDGILGPRTLEAFPIVKMGQRGNVVFVVQAALRLNSYDTGPLDGNFGFRTQAAVEMFQRDNGLTPDGIVDRAVISALLRNSAPQPSPFMPPRPDDLGSLLPGSPREDPPTPVRNRSYKRRCRGC